MKLNHLNLCTNDVAALADFFTRFFGFELVDMRGKQAFAILRGDDGFALNLMLPAKGGAADYPNGFHAGFLVEQAAHVAGQAQGIDGRRTGARRSAGTDPGRRRHHHLLLQRAGRNSRRGQRHED